MGLDLSEVALFSCTSGEKGPIVSNEGQVVHVRKGFSFTNWSGTIVGSLNLFEHREHCVKSSVL